MEDSYRNNVVEFSMIYNNKRLDMLDFYTSCFNSSEFTNFIFKHLFDVDIESSGYGLDGSTRQMTNDIGDLKIYNENDLQKINYLIDIKKGDLVFFHEQALDSNSPTPNNRYPGHVGIYLGDNSFIHASLEEEKIVISSLSGKWLDKLVASRDIIKEINYNDLNKKIC